MLHIPPTNYLLVAAKQEAYQKAHLLTKNTEDFSGGNAGIVDFCLIYRYREKKKYKKGMARIFLFYLNAQWPVPVPFGSMLHIPPTNYHLLAAKQEPFQKAFLLTKNTEDFSGKMSEEWASGQNNR